MNRFWGPLKGNLPENQPEKYEHMFPVKLIPVGTSKGKYGEKHISANGSSGLSLCCPFAIKWATKRPSVVLGIGSIHRRDRGGGNR